MAKNLFRVCNQCSGSIPKEVNFIFNVSGFLKISGTVQNFSDLDFCSTQHMIDWINTQPVIPVPNPLYTPAPQPT